MTTETQTPTDSPLPLIQAIHSVMSGINRLKNDGTNTQQNFNFASVHAVYDYVRPLMTDVGLIIIPAMVGYELSEYQTKRGGTVHRATVTFEFTIACTGTSFMMKERFTVHGDDYGDKSFTKAASFADKYFLLKLFKISTGDEVESDSQSYEAAKPAHWYDDSGNRKAFIKKLREVLDAPQDWTNPQVEKHALVLVNEDGWRGYGRGSTAVHAVQAVHEAKQEDSDWIDDIGDLPEEKEAP